METSTMGFVSGDAHVNEPRDLWRENLPASLRDRAMRGIEAGDDGGWALVLEGDHIFKTGMSEEERTANVRAEHRLAVMREEGIRAEAIFPTIGLYVWMLKDADAGRASCRVYNEWIEDQLAVRSERFCCAGLVPAWDVEGALDEIARIAESRLGALMLPAVALPSWNHPQWDPVWAAAAETGLPVVMHQGTGHDMVWHRGPGASVTNLMATQSIAPRTATMLACSGVLERHPSLHVVFVEFNIGWLAWAMETADFYTESFDRYGVSRFGRPWISPKLAAAPSEYMRRQVHATFQYDAVGLHNIARTGAEALLWGNDYPHEEGTYPRSKELVAELAAGLDDADVRKVFRDNAARLFGFSPEVLAAPA